MKTVLLFAAGSAIAVASEVIPNVPAKLIVSAFVLMGALITAARQAPVGYEKGSGLHLVKARRPVVKCDR
jgi:hypothetical protein